MSSLHDVYKYIELVYCHSTRFVDVFVIYILECFSFNIKKLFTMVLFHLLCPNKSYENISATNVNYTKTLLTCVGLKTALHSVNIKLKWKIMEELQVPNKLVQITKIVNNKLNRQFAYRLD